MRVRRREIQGARRDALLGENAQQNNEGERLTAGRFALFFLPLVIGLVTDLVTKSYMFANFFDPARRYQPPNWWVEGVLGVQTSTNPGALFGMGSGYSWLFAIFSIVALLGILSWLFIFKAAIDRWLTFSLGLIGGGILGNLYDRLGFGFDPSYPSAIQYNVRDWILFRLEGVRWFDPWPNFNVADMCLVCGAVMLFFHAFFYEDDEEMDADESEGELAQDESNDSEATEDPVEAPVDDSK